MISPPASSCLIVRDMISLGSEDRKQRALRPRG